MTTTQPPTTRATLGTVGTIVDARAGALQRGVAAGRPQAITALARLRRGAGKQVGELPDLLEYTLADELHSRGDAPTAEEEALHVAMTLFALHQQSRSEPMHQRGPGLGAALRGLHTGHPNEVPEPLRRRFRVLVTAASFAELTYHLRGAVQLLRAGGVALDYGRLADQLVWWQRPGGRDRVGLAWGREFHRTAPKPEPTTQATTEPATEA